MKSNEILKSFLSLKCPECGGGKQKGTGFCGRCYHKLPAKLKTALWKRFGEGFEEAFKSATEHFDLHRQQRKLAL